MVKIVEKGAIHGEVLDFVMETCCNCSIPFFMPMYKKKELLADRGTSFYCPNGHGQHYTGKSEQQLKLEQLEKDKKAYENAYLEEITKREKAEKDLKRLIKKGICPCCTRNFTNVKRHIAHMHPEYKF